MLGADLPRATAMTIVTGKTKNGFTYEGDYQYANPDCITWKAVYRRSDHFYGMRHGRIDELKGVSTAEVDDAVKDDIESIWSRRI